MLGKIWVIRGVKRFVPERRDYLTVAWKSKKSLCIISMGEKRREVLHVDDALNSSILLIVTIYSFKILLQ